MPMFFLPILLTILFTFVNGTLYADVRDELKGINSEIREKQQLLRQTRKVESKVTSELTQIERNLKEKESALNHLNSELKTVESGVISTQ